MHSFARQCRLLQRCCSHYYGLTRPLSRHCSHCGWAQPHDHDPQQQYTHLPTHQARQPDLLQTRAVSQQQQQQPPPALPQQQQQQQQQHSLQPEPAGTFLISLKEARAAKGKTRLDAYLTAQLPAVSRAKISASIKAGLVLINGSAVVKPSQGVKGGDVITVSLLPPEPCTAIPEAIPLNVVFEDEHLIVVNKAAGMVVHLSPGHSTGTLVNALLAHCGLPPCEVACGSSGSGLLSHAAAGGAGSSSSGLSVVGGMLEDELEEGEDDEAGVKITPEITSNITPSSYSSSSSSSNNKGILRPGIVHRLDRGTSGLMVVAKSDFTHAHLCSQFKERSVSRVYNSITTGVPNPTAARVATNIVRDPGNRLRMMAVPYGSGRGRTAASNYRSLEVLAGGGAAVVQWRLETGRTHQIRVHAKHICRPLLGDDLYGSGHAAAAKAVVGRRSSLLVTARCAIEEFGRPALHARTLGFTHPVTQERLEFDSELPQDFMQLYQQLKELQ